MEKKKTGISQTGARMPVVLLKSLLVSYLMAGALLLLLALLLCIGCSFPHRQCRSEFL